MNTVNDYDIKLFSIKSIKKFLEGFCPTRKKIGQYEDYIPWFLDEETEVN